MCFGGLPCADNGPCRRAGVGQGTGRVVFTEGPRPPGVGLPALRPWTASGTGTATPQSRVFGGSGCAPPETGQLLRSCVPAFMHCAAKGALTVFLPWFPYSIGWGWVVRRPSTRHLAFPPSPALPP